MHNLHSNIKKHFNKINTLEKTISVIAQNHTGTKNKNLQIRNRDIQITCCCKHFSFKTTVTAATQHHTP